MEINNDFASLGLSERTLEVIRKKGFEKATPIQALAIPVLVGTQSDIIGLAQTGTGKTAAYGLPIIDLIEENIGTVQAIILVPTRELALQVTEEMLSFKGDHRLQIISVYGGQSMSEQLRRLRQGVEIVVGTPGRILDHLSRGSLKLDNVKYLVLDEADEMLNMGFVDDIEEIMSKTPEDRRTFLFSATMPDRIARLSKKYMKNPQRLEIERKQMTADLTDQIYFEVSEGDRFDALTRIIDIEPEFYGLVFCRTRIAVDDLVARLNEHGYASDGLHGEVSQTMREKILKKFKTHQINILVATDVAARGIDIHDLTHVINYSMPQDPDSYVHRIGRTGRAGKEGTAITFISSNEYRSFVTLQKVTRNTIRKEKLPHGKDVVAVKKARILGELSQIVETGTFGDYLGMAEDMLASASPEVTLASLLKMAFKNELSEKNYPEIRSFNVDRKGKARVFIALGKRDGYAPGKLTDMIKEKTSLTDSRIDEVEVLENFSFVTVSFADAEAILAVLNKDGRGGRPIAEIASKKEGGSAGGGSRGGRREGGFRREGGSRDGGSREGGSREGGRREGGYRREGGSREGGSPESRRRRS
ncbi:DEAD/DEAH box helicase [Williamwhitmania taraxaci]|uniref:DEAD-box ATP-dependent RNA helicase RhpA n=1 Tax=Williamwhitmania taraxaci TaxID=1640674 RepID=A0A1G6H5N5_9BACT|nr:DEAD/DEAH box helicase [Williamwhitmania taraxaci]SDB89589.1 ATP-dependent RNA helicase DeaD [Williamwhitmania taraxaci]